MCTLIVGVDILGSGSVILGANRDEDPARPSDPPGVLLEAPRLVGGRDQMAGGTWLAIRERRAAVAMLNRRYRATASPDGVGERRSRGLLALDVARVMPQAGEPAQVHLPERALHAARNLVAAAAYAPFSLVFLSPESSWVLSHDPGELARVTPLTAGWHVLTHAELDDPTEPRTARLMEELRDFRPATVEEAENVLAARLSEHGVALSPAVCIHEGRMVTVSSSIVVLGPGVARYRHSEGRPCEHPAQGLSHLLGDPAGIGTPSPVA